MVPKDVVLTFGIDQYAPLKSLPGGSLTCYLAGKDIVFRPSEDDAESEQIAQIMRELNSIRSPSALYRVSYPVSVANDTTRFVHNGWTAWSFVSGQPRDEMRWDEILQTCRAFHQDIGKLDMSKPEFLSRPMSRFREADRVAWDEMRLCDLPMVADEDLWSRISEPLRQLESLKRELSDATRFQLVHGDIAGNMLFEADGQPPGIIDLTFYWRPATTAAAIVVADGLMWNGQGDSLIKMYGTDSDSIQILIRALLFRTVTWAIDLNVVSAESDAAWRRKMLPMVSFDEPVRLIRKYVE